MPHSAVVSLPHQTYTGEILILFGVHMTDHEAVESSAVEADSEDSSADAISAVALVLIAVVIALYWVANQ
jgi:metal-responsive CopG/Arc/MetJ family transcriptional regulator